ncbi:DUF3800 domain-containing protein [Enterococcus olivae]
MGIAFIDEKGPQERIKIAKQFDDNRRINLGDDLMKSYVADLIYIPNDYMELLYHEFSQLLMDYKATKKNKSNKELKGAAVLKGNFEYGIASLKRENSDFYTKLFETLLKGEAKNLLFAVNKMSLVVDARLTEWLLKLEERRLIPNVALTKYALTKYLEIEASEEIVRAFFNEDITNKKLTYLIISDLKDFIKKHKGLKRMERQIYSYKELITILKKNKHLIDENIISEVYFDWDKVSFAIDLWVTEKKVGGSWIQEENKLILDEGIPLEPFDKIGFDKILENQDSKKHLGLQLADFVVVISGSLISRLVTALKYDKNQPGEFVILNEKWFDLEEHQFKLICVFSEFLLGEEMQYGIVSDTYFDETLLFETYINYISSYGSYEKYKKVPNKYHPEKHFSNFSQEARNKEEASRRDEFFNRKMYGSLRLVIKEGVKRKI